MYSVWIVEIVHRPDYDVSSYIEAVCETQEVAANYIRKMKDSFEARCGRPWNDDHYHEGHPIITEHYLHV